MMIEITRTPPGQAPEEVRKAWIGMKLPSIGRDMGQEPGSVRSDHSSDGGYMVEAPVALAALKIYNPVAFEWWMNYNPVLLFMGKLIFHADVCKEVI